VEYVENLQALRSLMSRANDAYFQSVLDSIIIRGLDEYSVCGCDNSDLQLPARFMLKSLSHVQTLYVLHTPNPVYLSTNLQETQRNFEMAVEQVNISYATFAVERYFREVG
jgi:hypothetical protein